MATDAKKLVQSVFFWALAVGILAYLFYRVPFGRLAEAWTRFDLAAFFWPMFLFYVILFFIDAYAHAWVIRRFGSPLPFAEVLRARGASYLLAGLGFLYGQGSIAYILSRKTGRPLAEMGGIIVFLAYNTLQALFILPTVSLFFLRGQDFGRTVEFRLLLLFLALAWLGFVLSLVFWVGKWPAFLRRRLNLSVLTAFDQARLADYAWLIGLRLAQILCWMALTILAMRALELRLPLAEVLLRLPIILLIGAVPTPGRLGTTQGAWVLLFAGLAPEQDLFLFSLAWTMSMNLLRWLNGLLFYRHFSPPPKA